MYHNLVNRENKMQKNIHMSGFNTLKKHKIINTEAERARIYNKREILSFF